MFQNKLLELRKLHKLTQAKLAENLNNRYETRISKSMISRWEKGLTDPQMNYVRIIADYFEVAPTVLIDDAQINDHDISPIYNQLKNENKVIIYEEAKRLLNKQNGIVSINDAKHNYSGTNHELEILGSVSAGTGEYLDDNAQRETIQYFGNVPVHDYAVRVNGDSMTPLFEDGQIIFVKTDNSDFINGQIVIANVAGEAFVKKIELTENGAFLISLNSKYEPIEITDNSELKIEGTVIL